MVLSYILSISTVYVNTDSINAKDIDILDNQQATISDEQYSSNIKDIKLIKKQLIKGESLDIVVNLITKEDKNDNLILEYKNKNSKSSIYLECKYDEENNRYIGNTIISNNAMEGQWKISSIYKVKADSSTQYLEINNEWIENTIFYIVKNKITKVTKEQIEKPQIEYISLDKRKVKTGETINIDVKFKEGKLECGDFIEVNYYIENDRGSYGYGIGLYYDASKNVYKGFLDIHDGMPYGTYKLNNIQIRSYETESIIHISNEDYDFSKYDIQLDTKWDTEGPELISVEVDKKEVSPGDKVKITVDAKDEIGNVKYVNLNLTDANGKFYYISLQKGYDTDKLVGSIYITHAYPNGKLSIDNVTLYDSNNNYTYITKEDYDFSNCEIEVKNSKEDSEGPELISIEVDKKEVNPGDTVKITVDAKDEKGNVEGGSLEITDANGKFYYISLQKEEGTDKLVGSLEITNRYANGKLSIDYAHLYDSNGNYTLISNSEYDFSNCEIEVKNSKEDFEGPELISVDIDKK
ncbi:MAG TPA: hypothetical protein K8U79_11360 [Clostridium perfringens]|nr:hypothetical protein [Clostridium perfringens]